MSDRLKLIAMEINIVYKGFCFISNRMKIDKYQSEKDTNSAKETRLTFDKLIKEN
jgi:hypothetical protein